MNHAGGQCHGSILINESSPKKESGSGGSNVEGWKAEKGANIISVIMRQALGYQKNESNVKMNHKVDQCHARKQCRRLWSGS